MNKRFLFPLVAVAGLTGMAAIGALIGTSAGMIADNKTDIDRCIRLKGNSDACDRIRTTSEYVPDCYQPTIDIALGLRKDTLQRREVIKQKRAAEFAEASKKGAAAIAKQDAERKQAAAQADAKFKAEGWWEAQPCIFVRWCTETCNNSKVIGDNRYSLMEVWAKDAHAGDIYAQVNLEHNGVVIGWTNDTMYLSRGQRGVLTFDSHQHFDQAQLVKFNARG